MTVIAVFLSQNFVSLPTVTYSVAGHLVVSDTTVDLLQPFALETTNLVDSLDVMRCIPSAVLSEMVFEGRTEIAGRECEVECRSGPEGYRLRMGPDQEFGIALDGSIISKVNAESGNPRDDNLEDFLEPPLILALALQGTYCLHAGAVRLREGAIAFVGDSGAGKSTLAGFLSSDDACAATRLADDLLPVTIADDGPRASPRFPQRKLGDEFRGSDDLPLSAIYLIDSPSGENAEQAPVEILPMSGTDALISLVRHTVATRLLDETALALHMDFCGRLAERVAVRRLRYARRFEVLPEVRDEIRRDLQAQAAR